MTQNLYSFSAQQIDGSNTALSQFKGKVVLVVNVASKCGFTPQYKGLEAVYRRHKDQGLEILGFPCDQFGHQEPGDESQIQEFCSLNYDVSFPMFSKIKVNGPEAHPLYQWLKAQAPGLLGTEAVKWNFTKFLIDREGNVFKRYGSMDKPEDIAKEIGKLLGT
jgi:glutathione peroxidase